MSFWICRVFATTARTGGGEDICAGSSEGEGGGIPQAADGRRAAEPAHGVLKLEQPPLKEEKNTLQ